MYQLPEMIELSGAELDAVTGGQAEGVAVAAGGLVTSRSVLPTSMF
jgi:hypothetical protein